MIAWLNLRHGVPERWDAWTRGLRRMGFEVREGTTTRPGDRDVLVTWNRVQDGRIAADAFEARGRPVVVTENATWGNDFNGRRWYHVALGRHNTAGRFPIGADNRWDDLGVELAPWRAANGDTVLLPQRGIGIPGVAMPADWLSRALKRHPGAKVRQHPGNKPGSSLDEALRHTARVVTWGSGAAVKALLWGIPVTSDMPNWIGEQDNTDAGRLAMFRRLAWAQWQLHEIAQGSPIARILNLPL